MKAYFLALVVVVIAAVAGVAAYVIYSSTQVIRTTMSDVPEAGINATTSVTTSTTTTSSAGHTTPSGGVLKIFCAGSLKIPLEKVSELFKSEYGVDARIEASGSVMAVRKVIDLGKPCDVLVLADYRLIPKFMVPKYASWYVAFASNEIVIAFTDKSKYANELLKDPSKWYEVLASPDVRYGFSDPNKDPCGYRAVGVIALASIYYGNSSILDELVLSKSNIKVAEVGNVTHIYVPASLEVKAEDLVVRPKSVDLIALLEAGALDYAFEYKSVAVQHGLKYIELPSQINLRYPEYKDFYGKVVVHILVGSDKENEIPMAPVIYGVTIPKNSENPELGLKFIELLLSKGGNIFESLGQPFLEKPIGYGDVPKELLKYVGVEGK